MYKILKHLILLLKEKYSPHILRHNTKHHKLKSRLTREEDLCFRKMHAKTHLFISGRATDYTILYVQHFLTEKSQNRRKFSFRYLSTSLKMCVKNFLFEQLFHIISSMRKVLNYNYNCKLNIIFYDYISSHILNPSLKVSLFW